MKDAEMSRQAWQADEMPREKFLTHGAAVLSEAELLAILLRTGTKNQNAVELARELLNRSGNNLQELGRMSLREMSSIKGMGNVKSLTLLAALELGRRRKSAEMPEKPKITSSKDAAKILQPILADLEHEEFHVLMLNRAHRVIGRKKISMGGISGTVVDSKIIFSAALEFKASSIILSHNHPSANTKPSDADLQLTKKLKEGARSLDISILDHIIIAGTSFYSFADEGLL